MIVGQAECLALTREQEVQVNINLVSEKKSEGCMFRRTTAAPRDQVFELRRGTADILRHLLDQKFSPRSVFLLNTFGLC